MNSEKGDGREVGGRPSEELELDCVHGAMNSYQGGGEGEGYRLYSFDAQGILNISFNLITYRFLFFVILGQSFFIKSHTTNGTFFSDLIIKMSLLMNYIALSF
jgi:hypothetical protein